MFTNKLERFFNTGKTRNINFRKRQLHRLYNAVKEHEAEILNCLSKDLSKSPFEGYATEISAIYSEINDTIGHLDEWAKPEKAVQPIYNFPSSGTIYKEPLGVVLIISPWNYPFLLALSPLIAAIGAGNCAVIKPSEFSDNTSELIKRLIESVFPPYYVNVVIGDANVGKQLLTENFDYIFFTGSPKIGKIVMESAAKNLTPVTLELGGKSPCIVDKSANIHIAAKKVIWGKCINAGQTCVAPDYVLAERQIAKRLLDEMGKSIIQMYGREPLKNNEFPCIITDGHFDRVCGLMNGQKILFGGKLDRNVRKIEPTLIEAQLNSPIMQEEIFGPLLPVITVDNMDEAKNIIRKNPYPLALYLFTEDERIEKEFIEGISFGGGCINDTLIHLLSKTMPFGGVGNSGMGYYHGKWGFDTFTHQKSVVKKYGNIDIPLRYPPYDKKLALL